jgi:hypothetical protein
MIRLLNYAREFVMSVCSWSGVLTCVKVCLECVAIA